MHYDDQHVDTIPLCRLLDVREKAFHVTIHNYKIDSVLSVFVYTENVTLYINKKIKIKNYDFDML